jgi:hypothetical protein
LALRPRPFSIRRPRRIPWGPAWARC